MSAMRTIDAASRGKKNKRLYLDTNLQILFGVTLTAIMGVSSITPAFPKIIQELAISPEKIGLLITCFTFPGILLTPVLGVMADRLGRKKILIPSLMLFGLAGISCSLVQDFNKLIILRFIQGIGAASLGSINATIIGDLFSGKERAAAMGYNASVLSIGTASYPVIGGALATLGWHYPFMLSIIAFPVGLLALFALKNPEPLNKQHLKIYISQALKTIRNRHVIVLFIACLFTFIILFGSCLTYFPFLIGNYFGKSPIIIGVMMSSMSLTTAITSTQLGKLVKIFSEKSLLMTSYFLYALALVIIPFLENVWLLFIPIAIFGLGNGLNIPNILSLLADLAPANQRAVLMSINGTVFRMGQTLGPILISMVFAAFGLDGAFFAGAVCAIFLFIIVTAMLK